VHIPLSFGCHCGISLSLASSRHEERDAGHQPERRGCHLLSFLLVLGCLWLFFNAMPLKEVFISIASLTVFWKSWLR
jgi:hypothetical protein